MGIIRTFVSFEPPSPIRAAIDTFQHKLKSTGADVRWEPSDKFHSTLKFFGDVEESMLPSLFLLIENIAKQFPPFHVVYETSGVFPHRRQPKVIWVGCSNSDGSMEVFKNRLDDAFLPMGFEIDRRPFWPHVTLGRVRSTERLDNLLSLMETLTFEPASTVIDGILVMKSVLQPQGAEYSLLHSIHMTSQ